MKLQRFVTATLLSCVLAFNTFAGVMDCPALPPPPPEQNPGAIGNMPTSTALSILLNSMKTVLAII